MTEKKKKILWLELSGFVFTLIVGTGMHFGFELSGFNHSLAWLFPVNESPWEHLKLSFYPIVFWSLIQYAMLRRNMLLKPTAPDGVRNYWFARVLGAYIAIMTTVVSWSLQYWLMGRSILAVDITMMYAGLLASALLCWILLTASPLRCARLVRCCTAAGLACLLAGFILFSYRVPLALLWKDRPCQSYGMIEYHLLFNRQLPAHFTDPATVASLPALWGFVPLVLVGAVLAVGWTAGRRETNR